MFDQLPSNGWNTTGCGDPLTLDEVHGLFGVPAPHQNNLAATVDRGDQRRHETAHVKQGYGQQGHPLGKQMSICWRKLFTATYEVSRDVECGCLNMGRYVSMG